MMLIETDERNLGRTLLTEPLKLVAAGAPDRVVSC